MKRTAGQNAQELYDSEFYKIAAAETPLETNSSDDALPKENEGASSAERAARYNEDLNRRLEKSRLVLDVCERYLSSEEERREWNELGDVITKLSSVTDIYYKVDLVIALQHAIENLVVRIGAEEEAFAAGNK